MDKFEELLTAFIKHIEAHKPYISTTSYMYVRTQIMILRQLSYETLIDDLKNDRDVTRFYKDTLGITKMPEELVHMSKKSQLFIDALLYNWDVAKGIPTAS